MRPVLDEALSPLERAVVQAVAAERWPGISLSAPIVTKRKNTGAGRFTHLEDRAQPSLADGPYWVGGGDIEMDGRPYGLSTNGEVSWDGDETRPWRLVREVARDE